VSDQYSFRVHVERVENGQYLATSDELPGLVAQGRTVEETLGIAGDVARRLVESDREHGDELPDSLIGIKEIGVFGSYIRGEQRPDSDLDVLIDIERPAKMDLLKLIDLEQELSTDLGVTVDLVLKPTLRPSLGKEILSEVVYL